MRGPGRRNGHLKPNKETVGAVEAAGTTGQCSQLQIGSAASDRAGRIDWAKARGYRSLRNLKAITYLIAGKLDLKLPT